MDYFTHKGKNAVLITTEDLRADTLPGASARAFWLDKIEEFKEKDVAFIFICTSTSYLGLPKALKEIAADVEPKNCYLLIVRD